MNDKNENKDKRNMTLQYGLIQYIYWTGFAIISPFASVYLQGMGLSNSAIGVVLSGGAFIGAVLQPFLGSAIDNSHKLSNRIVIAILSVMMMLDSLIMWLCPVNSALLIAILFAVNYILLQLALPFTNALGVEYINDGYSMNFGVSRAAGSFGYAISAYVMGILTERVGVWTVPCGCAGAFLFLMASLIIFMPALKNAPKKSVTAPKKENPMAFLKKYPVFGITLLGLICIYITHTLINTYSLQILKTKGGTGADVGMAAAIAAGLELLPMLFFPHIQKRFSLRTLLRISALFFNIKILATLLVPNVLMFMVIQIFQMGGWGILAITIVFYVNEVIDVENASQGQAFAGLSMTMGTVIASLICGRLLDIIGVNATLIVGCIVGVVGLITIAATTVKR